VRENGHSIFNMNSLKEKTEGGDEKGEKSNKLELYHRWNGDLDARRKHKKKSESRKESFVEVDGRGYNLEHESSLNQRQMSLRGDGLLDF